MGRKSRVGRDLGTFGVGNAGRKQALEYSARRGAMVLR